MTFIDWPEIGWRVYQERERKRAAQLWEWEQGERRERYEEGIRAAETGLRRAQAALAQADTPQARERVERALRNKHLAEAAYRRWLDAEAAHEALSEKE